MSTTASRSRDRAKRSADWPMTRSGSRSPAGVELRRHRRSLSGADYDQPGGLPARPRGACHCPEATGVPELGAPPGGASTRHSIQSPPETRRKHRTVKCPTFAIADPLPAGRDSPQGKTRQNHPSITSGRKTTGSGGRNSAPRARCSIGVRSNVE